MNFKVFCGTENLDCFLSYDVILSCKWLPVFWRNLLPPTLMMEVINSSEMLVFIHLVKKLPAFMEPKEPAT